MYKSKKEKFEQILLLFDMIYNKKRINLYDSDSKEHLAAAVYFGESATSPGQDIWVYVDKKGSKNLLSATLFSLMYVFTMSLYREVDIERPRCKDIILLLKEYKAIEKQFQAYNLPDFYELYNDLRRCRKNG